MERLFWEQVKVDNNYKGFCNVCGKNIVYYEEGKIYRFSWEENILEEVAVLGRKFDIGVQIVTEPSFKIFLIFYNYSQLFLFKDNKLVVLANTVGFHGFDMQFTNIFYTERNITTIINIKTNNRRQFNNTTIRDNTEFNSYYDIAELIFIQNNKVYLLIKDKTYEFLAKLIFTETNDRILLYEEYHEIIVDYGSVKYSILKTEVKLDSLKPFQITSYFAGNLYLFSYNNLYKFTNNTFKLVLSIETGGFSYEYLVANYLISMSGFKIFQFVPYQQNPFSRDILEAVFPINDFRIRLSQEVLRVSKSLMYAYSSIVRTHPEYNCIKFPDDSEFTAATINNTLRNCFHNEIIANSEVKKLLELQCNPNTTAMAYIAKNLTFDDSYFTINDNLLHPENNFLMEVNLRENTRNRIVPGLAINLKQDADYTIYFIKNVNNYEAILKDATKDLWYYTFKRVIDVVAQFDITGKYLLFIVKYSDQFRTLRLLNLATLKFFGLSDFAFAINHKPSLSTTVTTLTGLITNFLLEEESDFSLEGIEEPYLVFGYDIYSFILDFKSKTIIQNTNMLIRKNFTELIVYLNQDKENLLFYFLNAKLIQKASIEVTLLNINSFGFSGAAFILIIESQIYSIKTKTLKLLTTIKGNYRQLSFHGKYILDRDYQLSELQTFHNNPFTSSVISGIISNIPDITIISSLEEEFLFNKTILYAYSETFRDFLSSNFGEQQSLNTISEFTVACTQKQFFGAFSDVLHNTNFYFTTRRYLGFPF